METTVDFLIPADVRRERTVGWLDGAIAGALTARLSGLEVRRGILDRKLPARPMARAIGIRCVVAEPSESAMRLDHDA